VTQNGKIKDEDSLRALDLYLEYGSMSEVARIMGLSGYHRAKTRVLKGAALRGVEIPRGKVSVKPAPDRSRLRDLKNREGKFTDTVTGDLSREVSTVSRRVLNLDDLLLSAGVDKGEWKVESWSANKWETFSKTEGVVELWQIKASLIKTPDWIVNPVVTSPPIKRKSRSKASTKTSGIETVLVIPDSQNGYTYDPKTQYYDPLHDRRAWDVSIQIAKDMNPDKVVLLGDMLDLAPFSRFPTGPNLRHTTQPSLLELHWWLSQLRKACPSQPVKFLEGNHESRIYRAIIDQFAGEFATLTPADDPDGHSLLSIERLLGLDSLDIDYISPYGKAWWLWNKVMFHHGTTVRSNSGGTVAAVLKDANHHQVFGHIHRTELASKRLHGPNDTSRVIYAMTPGSLCRTDGVVPSASPRLNWQQGLGVVQLDEATGTVHMNVIHIEDGVALYGGKRYEGRERREEIAEGTGWPF
jgi:hypothetical protein